MTKIFNRQDQKEKRRELRKNSTKAESILWDKLRDRRLLGYKFRRQYSVKHFVLDLYCPKFKLAIEVDGKSHDSEEAKKYDKLRQEYIETLGIRFIRIKNEDVISDIENVLESIKINIKNFQ